MGGLDTYVYKKTVVYEDNKGTIALVKNKDVSMSTSNTILSEPP